MKPTTASHLIIAGVTRAATTSLFHYLADHPAICRSTIKETRFFLDDDLGLPRLHAWADGPELYKQFFAGCTGSQVLLEASPDYLHGAEVPGRIAEALPQPRVVFILREPTGRLVSWYRYALQNGQLPAGVSFAQYVQAQLTGEPIASSAKQVMQTLAQGHYARDLSPWLNALPASDMLIVTQEHLQASPGEVCKAICDFAGIEPSFYDDYTFAVHNESRAVRWPMLQKAVYRVSWWLKPLVHNRPVLRAPLRLGRRLISKLLGKANRVQNQDTIIDDATLQQVAAYYAPAADELAGILGLQAWSWSQPPVSPAPTSPSNRQAQEPRP